MKKRGAIELSIGTIVIIVLAMSMLILGLVLVKNIFTGSTENVDQINDAVKDRINEAFNRDDVKLVVNLPNKIAKIKQGSDWGVAFGLKNLVSGTASSGEFSYEVVVSENDIETKCGISKAMAESWIVAGKSESFKIAPGDTEYGIIRFEIPETAPLCTVRFRIETTLAGTEYEGESFDIKVLA